MTKDAPDISAIVTCYREEATIEEFFARLQRSLRGLGCTFEIIMVNDGSEDGTWQVLQRLHEEQDDVRCVVDFFRNYGQQAAMTAGIVRARGRALLFMDSDLQLAPEEIATLYAEYVQGCDVVVGWRRERRDSLRRLLPSKLANLIMRRASGSDFRDFGCTFKVYDAKLVHAFGFGPRHRFSDVEVIAEAGRRKEVPVTHYPRPHGKSGWTFRKLWRYNMDNLMILSERPFQFIGAASLILGMAFLTRLLVLPVIDVRILDQVSNGLLLNALIAAFLVIVGVLCLIGELTLRVFTASRQRPVYIVREELDKLNEAAPAGD